MTFSGFPLQITRNDKKIVMFFEILGPPTERRSQESVRWVFWNFEKSYFSGNFSEVTTVDTSTPNTVLLYTQSSRLLYHDTFPCLIVGRGKAGMGWWNLSKSTKGSGLL